MNILPYKLTTTNDQLTSRAGLLTIAQLMQSMQLGEHIDQQFPQPGSNRGFKPSVFIETLILMQHEGSFHLDDVRNLHEEEALMSVLGLKRLPKASALGEWLRRMGNEPAAFKAWNRVNQRILQTALHHKREVTLDIDASEIVANKSEAQWTYKKNRGYMPMVGHIAEVSQIVGCDFREGNAAPAKENLEFIQQCEKGLPEGVSVKRLRIDSAGYQIKIIQYCDQQDIEYAIRAKMSRAIKEQIDAFEESEWKPLPNRQGEEIRNQQTCRMVHWIGGYEKPFTLIIQRKQIKGQTALDLEQEESAEQISDDRYIYRAIATNREEMSDSELVHWYNQRGEDSENRIKELKLDFGGDTLPCSDFQANALYLQICALSYNLFALMRQLLPEELAHHRVTTIRWRLYAIAAKIVKTSRQLYVKAKQKHQLLLQQVLTALRRVDPPPI
ncbi:MAG TPA: IS1380 family transposase [Gammaproteobacteria bacterium]|nr:IS1380 family transposase [Gammaproteobacteria bacterium]